MIIRLTAASCLVVLAAGTATAGGDRPAASVPQLLEAFQQSAGSIQTFRADVRVGSSGGAGSEALSKDMLRFAEWMEANGKADAAKSVRQNAALEVRPHTPSAMSYRYFVQTPNLIRVEDYGPVPEKGTPFDKEPVVRIFAADRWVDYAPPSRVDAPPNDEPRPQLLVHRDPVSLTQLLEVFRGSAVPLNSYLSRCVKPDARARGTGQIPWTELIASAPPGSFVETKEPLPSGGAALPLLTAQLGSSKDGWYAYRVRLWLDPARTGVPVRMECAHFEPNAITGNHTYGLDCVCEWSEPVELPNGSTVPGKCVFAHFARYMPPVAGADSAAWPGQTYEVLKYQVNFSNVRVNDRLDPGLFTLKPETGTNAVDEVTGYHYIVGPAGEQLQKSAIQAARQAPAPASLVKRRPGALAIIVIGTVALALLLFWIVRRRRAAESQ